MTRADLFTAAIIASGREVTQSDLDRALKMGRWMAGEIGAEIVTEPPQPPPAAQSVRLP